MSRRSGEKGIETIGSLYDEAVTLGSVSGRIDRGTHTAIKGGGAHRPGGDSTLTGKKFRFYQVGAEHIRKFPDNGFLIVVIREKDSLMDHGFQ